MSWLAEKGAIAVLWVFAKVPGNPFRIGTLNRLGQWAIDVREDRRRRLYPHHFAGDDSNKE